MSRTDGVKHALVVGLGRFGGGSGVARHLLSRGIEVRITDLRPRAELADVVEALESEAPRDGLSWRLGEHVPSDFTDTDLVVANPAIPHPWSNEHLETARTAGVPITTEIELGLERVPPWRLIGVTGSAGKSTTCAMMHHLLEKAGHRALLGGNIGGSLLDLPAERLDSADAVVVELSSFMLHWLGEEGGPLRPSVAAVTTLDPNHLDWHGSLEHYLESKRRLRASVSPDRFVGILDADAVSDPVVECSAGDHWWRPAAPDPFEAQSVRTRLVEACDLQLPGEHQARNAITALRAVSRHLTDEPAARLRIAEELAPLLASFEGLPHRLRPLGVHRGIRVFDDSKSTTPSATLRAVDAFPDPGRLHLIAGGYDKGADLGGIERLGDHLGGLYAVGATGARLTTGSRAIECGTIDVAVERASERMSPGDVLLLSPGCASWDQFENYEHRGEVFLAAVTRLLD